MSDSLILIIDNESAESSSIIKYDLRDHSSTIEPIKSNCPNLLVGNGIRMNEQEYLFSVSCGNDYEIGIINLENDSLVYLASDNTPETIARFPRDFIEFKEWFYFTAAIENESRQWFRIAKDASQPNIECINLTNSLIVYPSPTTNIIHAKKDLNQLSIYSINGELVHFQNVYQKNNSIPIELLNSGKYLVIAKDDEGVVHHGSFIKINP